VRAIYGFETVSATEWSSAAIGEAFRPARFCGIKDYLEAKVKALQCYATEMRPFPHARSIDAVRALALWRGASCGFEAAEAFTVIREISADEHPGTSTSNRQQAGQA
jgi:LmbE family N-acetylglucosaminyl deacetylase